MSDLNDRTMEYITLWMQLAEEKARARRNDAEAYLISSIMNKDSSALNLSFFIFTADDIAEIADQAEDAETDAMAATPMQDFPLQTIHALARQIRSHSRAATAILEKARTWINEKGTHNG